MNEVQQSRQDCGGGSAIGVGAALTASVGGGATGGSYGVPMVGPRLFRSRWAALFWAGGILWTAYDVADAASDKDTSSATNNVAAVDVTGAAVDAKDLAILAGMGNAN